MIQNIYIQLITAQNTLPIETQETTILPADLIFFFQTLVHSIRESGPFGQFILLILLGLSIVSWTITFERWKFFRSLHKTSNQFLEDIWSEKILSLENASWKIYNKSPLAHIYRSACSELEPKKAQNPNPGHIEQTLKLELVERALDRTISQHTSKMEKNLTFLATTATLSPYLGLLGTVWGILSTFYQMGLTGMADFTTIAPGLAEALITTVAGLLAAIPALIAYNNFTTHIRRLTNQMYEFSSELMSYIELNYTKR